MNETVKLEIIKGAAGLCLQVDEKVHIGARFIGGLEVLATVVVLRKKLLEALDAEPDELLRKLKDTIEDLTGSSAVAALGYHGALRQHGEERDRLEEQIKRARKMIRPEELDPPDDVSETVNLDVVRSRSGTCLYIDGENRIGPKPSGSTRRVEEGHHVSIEVPRGDLFKALGTETHEVVIMGETFEIDPDFRSIRKIMAIGDVVKTVEVTFGDPDVASLSPDPVELEMEQLLVPGRIVRYVDRNGCVFPAIVTHIYDEMHVDLQVFPRRAAPYPLTRVMRHLLGKMARIGNTWHWPSDR